MQYTYSYPISNYFTPRTMKHIIIALAFLTLPLGASAATLSVSPSTQTVGVGDTFTVSVRLDTQGSSIDGVDLRYLNFNPSILQVVDANTSTAGVQIAQGSLMPLTLLNSVDAGAGRVAFSQVVAGGTKYSGSGTLASITFKALAAGTAAVTFSYTPGNTTDSNIAASGGDILNAVINGSYTVRGGSTIAPLPSIAPIPSVNVPRASSPSSSVRPTLVVPDDEDVVAPSAVSDVQRHSFLDSIYDMLGYILARIKNGFSKLF